MMQKTPSDILFLEINDIITLQKLQLFKCCTNLPRRDFLHNFYISHIYILLSFLFRKKPQFSTHVLCSLYLHACYLFVLSKLMLTANFRLCRYIDLDHYILDLIP